MSVDQAGIANSKVQIYFGAVLAVFILSFMLGTSSKATNNLFYAFMALPALYVLVKHRGAGIFAQPLGIAWAVFMAWFFVPAVYSQDFQFYKHIVYVSLFVFAIGGLVNSQFLHKAGVARGLFWVICLYVLVSSVHSWVTGQFEFGKRVEILPARMANVIYTSAWLVGALGLALPVWLKERRWVEGASAIVLTLVIAALIVQTRTALVGAAFLFGICTLYSLYRFPKPTLVTLLVLAVATGIAFWVVKDEQWVKLLMVRGDSYRIELFEIMTGEWSNCGWFLGCGVDFVTTKTLTGGMAIQHPHNIFVSLGVYTGAMSLVLFIVVMAMTLWSALRLRSPWGLYLASSLVMLNFDGSKLVGNPDELWVLVLLPAAAILARVVQERHKLA